MSYAESIVIRTHDCDMGGHWKPSSILEAMQEAAGAHCNAVSLGRAVTSALGIAWVLSRCRVELRRHPRIGETVTVETWAMPTRHLFFPRAHTFRDADGGIIGESCGLWLLMDMNERKAVSSPFILERLPLEAKGVSVRVAGAVRPVGGNVSVGSMTPQYTDFDLNGHVNNAKYLDWCWNALGMEALRGRQVASFDVEYNREVRPGERIRTETAIEGDAFSFCGFAGDDARYIAIRGMLARSEG